MSLQIYGKEYYVNTLLEILRNHIQYRKQIWLLAKSDLSKAYQGTLFGWLWAVISPTITLFVFWFAFAIGLRSGRPVGEYSYFLWLMIGMVPWFCIRGMFTGGASSLRRYSFLITKIKYPIETIPTFVCVGEVVVHFALMVVVMAVFMVAGHFPDIYWIQFPFYMLLAFIFFSAWSLFSGLISAFSRDFLNLVRAISSALMWLSGIFYEADKIANETVKSVMMWNPITLIVKGYRNCFIYKEWFWENLGELRNFAIVYVIMLAAAVWMYRRLRKDIPDVL